MEKTNIGKSLVFYWVGVVSLSDHVVLVNIQMRHAGVSKLSNGMSNRWCIILNMLITLSCFLQSARGDQCKFSNILITLAYEE